MADNETGNIATDEAATEDAPAYEYNVQVEGAGTGSKKITIEIPRERIDEKLKQEFGDLRRQANIPGFRTGHAPQKLIEKRFATDVRDQVRRSLISESYEQALEKHNLQIIGEPEFENIDSIVIP